MKKLLIVYGTTEGQTAKVVRHLEKKAIKLGVEVTAYNATEVPPEPYGFDMVLLAGSIHMLKFQSALIHYATKNEGILAQKPNALIAVSLSAAQMDEESEEGLQKCVDGFVESTGWKPQLVEHVAGALKYIEYDFMKRFILKQIAKSKGHNTDTSQDHEFTDWNRLDEFMVNFISANT